MSIQNNVMKLCSFYVSDWHLTTMLLPYINRKINEENIIATVLENDISKNIETLVKKLNLKNEEKILNINWKDTKVLKTNEIIKENNNNVIIIVSGSKEYIEKSNKKLEKIIRDNIKKLENNTIKIVNCYEIAEYDGSITEILDKHDKILNTSGEKNINEVFENYTRKEKIG